jgi:hypothetical protein
MVLLGEVAPAALRKAPPDNDGGFGAEADGQSSFSPRARTWMRQNAVTAQELEQIFHGEGNAAEFIAGDIPGSSNKIKTINAYVLSGLSNFLPSGNAIFDDKAARSLCKVLGCYDEGNHASTIKDKGNLFTGGKDEGWTLTAPGLKHAANLVKQMAKNTE